MRVFVDTNVYISFLLHPRSPPPPARIIRAGLAGNFTVLASESVLLEIRRRCSEKPYLASRIALEEVDELAVLLEVVAEPVAPFTAGPIHAISRGRMDDFLLVEAALAGADFLVSGDPDLKVLEEFEGVRIVSLAEFAEILDL
jgi:putative PIN family toxin of toxin-antitoxin system